MDEISARFAHRVPVTQALAYSAALQDRGWGCVVAGGALLIMRARDGQMQGRLQRPRAIDVPLLRRLAAGTGLQSITVEPALAGCVWFDDARAPVDYAGDTRRLADLGFVPTAPIAHTRTQVVDLRGGDGAVMTRMHPTARRNVRKARAAPVDYAAVRFDEVDASLSDEVESLSRAFSEARPWVEPDLQFRAALVRRFADRGWLCIARDHGRLCGVVYLLVHDGVGSYYAAFTSPDAANARVPSGLVWLAMTTAAEAGCDLLDLVGVWDERYPDRYPRWKGFSRFKARFGGVDVALPPAMLVPGIGASITAP